MVTRVATRVAQASRCASCVVRSTSFLWTVCVTVRNSTFCIRFSKCFLANPPTACEACSIALSLESLFLNPKLFVSLRQGQLDRNVHLNDDGRYVAERDGHHLISVAQLAANLFFLAMARIHSVFCDHRTCPMSVHDPNTRVG